MHNQFEIDAANRLLRELREVDSEDNDPPTLAMPEAANDGAATREDRARA